MLKMKNVCERCQARLNHEDAAYICSYECTFCPICTEKMNEICPNCNGELVQRPTRRETISQNNNIPFA